MKTILLVSLILILRFSCLAQNVENPSFDSVYIGGIDRIHSWITSDAWPIQNDTVQPMNPNDHYISAGLQYHELLYSVQLEYTNPYHGPLAIKLLTDSDRYDIFGNTSPGFIVNGNHFYTDSNGYIDFKKCGEPFSYRPVKLHGHYMLQDLTPSLHNYPQAILLLKKYNSITNESDTIGYGNLSMQLFPVNTWHPFEIPITYLNANTPDTLLLAFTGTPIFPATCWLDSLGFDYSISTIASVDNNGSIHINSVEHKVYLEHPENIKSINFYTIQGQLILNKLPDSIIDFSQLTIGNYILKIEFKNQEIKSVLLKK